MTAEKVFFSIIIPTFNRGNLILDTIKSISDQGGVALEIIVVDDGSTDNTTELIIQLDDIKINYVKTENRERGAARNAGLKIAKGRYINYFDSDDILNPCLLDLSKFITANNFPDVVYGQIETVTDDGKSKEIITLGANDFRNNILHNNFLACGSVFIKREVALKHLFSEERRLSGTEDWELWLRLYSQRDFIQSPITIFKQREHASRSLNNVPAERVTEREKTFIAHINTNKTTLLKKFSETDINLLIADRFTLIALSQSQSRFKGEALNYLVKSLLSSSWVIKRRRFWATLKKIILD